MERMRAVVAALALLGWAGFAHALGLGEIEVKSRLNQPLLAIIPLSAASGEADDLIVELASNEEFERAGLERAEFLSSLRFEVQGEAIKVTSRQIAREPFVSFLVDVRWSGGRLLREYTVLLDPPTMAQQSRSTMPAPMAAPSASPPPAEAAPSASAPATAPETASTPPEAPMAAPVDAPAATASTEGGNYGPVSPKETLWSIAYKLRPDPNTITMDQMQVAIFNANPQAFHGGNLTGLMKGVTLRIPSSEEIRAIDPASAKSQVAAARSGAAPAPAPAPVEQAVAPAPEYTPPPPPKEEPAPVVETPPPAPAETAPAPTAEVVTPPPAEVAQAPAETTPPPSETAPVEQAPAPTPPPSEAAQPTPAPAAPAPAPEEPGMVAGLLEKARSLKDHPWAIPGVLGIFVLIALIVGGRKVADKIAKWRYERASRKPQVEPVAMASGAGLGNEDVTQVAEAPSMESALQEASFEASAPPPMSVTQTQAMPAVEATMQQTIQQTQAIEPAQARSGKVDFDVTGSFASETVQINLDAGDPVSEAEFHRAYGLYDEAALLLKQALQKDPKRTDAKVKLAEIYFEASKKNEFVDVARELKGTLPEAEWQKIALLGSQIAPEDGLFAGGAVAAGGTVDLSFDEPAAPAAAPAPSAPSAPAASAPADDLSLDFKLEDVQLPSAPAAPAPASAPPAEPGLEFDLGSLTLDVPAASSAPEPTVATPSVEAPQMTEKLDLGDFDLSAAADAPAAGGGDVVELSADMAPAGGGDESSTKLDLARAYIDMGDSDMAKSLLNEVAQQGNADQQKEAQELLKRVG